MSKNIGKVSKVIGAVVDVEFSSKEGILPNIYDSLEIKKAVSYTHLTLPTNVAV